MHRKTGWKNEVFAEGAAGIGIHEAEYTLVTITPNPTGGIINVELPNASHAHMVRVMDLTGRVVLEKSFDLTSSLEI